LTNPAGARRQLIGVSDASFLETIAGALAQLGVDRALVVAGEDGLDEISASAPTKVVEVNHDEITRYVLQPSELGVEPGAERAGAERGGTPQENAAVTRAILQAERHGGLPAPGEGLALVNAGAAIYAAGRVDTIAEGVQAARAALAEGLAASALERYVAASRADAETPRDGHTPTSAPPGARRQGRRQAGGQAQR
jgi:anthranilate phosphoribosyltransferase